MPRPRHHVVTVIAERDCILECGAEQPGYSSEDATSSSSSGKRKRGACSEHAKKTQRTFAHILKSVGCVCRELTSRNLESCCKKPAVTVTKSSSPVMSGKEERPEKPMSSPNFDKGKRNDRMTDDKLEGFQTTSRDVCTEKEFGTCETRALCGEDVQTTIPGTCGSSYDPAVTSPHKTSWREPDGRSTSERKACCAKSRSAIVEERSGDDCCRTFDSSTSRRKRTSDVGLDDVEKGPSFREHVSLSVQGLTCTGCETKLYKALHDIRGVSNLHTSLVLSQAEFDVDEQACQMDEIVKTVEKATGFSCQRSSSTGQSLDVMVDGDAKAFVEHKYPVGITLISVLGPHEIRVTFDPNVIGAREVLENAFGSNLELSALRAGSDLVTGRKHVRRTAWVTLLSAVLTIPVLVLAWAPLNPRPITYGAASLALATAVQFLVAGQFYISALKALVFTRVMEMDLLIVLSTTTAYLCSVVSFAFGVSGRPLPVGDFFETSTLLVTLIMLGRLVSAFARQKAVETVSVRSLQHHRAVVCDQDGDNPREIDARLLQYGDLFRVGPDSRITTDGVVVTGSTQVDESMVTGEALPIEKRPGAQVIAGSINGSGVIIVRLTSLPGNNTISTIAAMVDEAKFGKAKTQELVDHVASWFVPIILILAAATFLIWIAIGIAVRHQGAGASVVHAIAYAVSVLIVSCPCAIGLCVPMVILVGGGVAAKHGIIAKSATAFENGRKVSHVIFDKTGTLTEGKLQVADEAVLTPDNQIALSVTLGLVSISKHPVSEAIKSHLQAKGIQAAVLKDVRSIAGKGIEGTYNGTQVRCGNSRFLSLEEVPEVQRLLRIGLTVFCVTIKHNPMCFFGLSDRVRPETNLVLAELKNRKIAISILSGDDAGATELLAAQLGVPSSNLRSRCSPADKQNYLKDLARGKRDRIVFCGDGANDAVALAQADIGVHMSTGSEIAQTAADVVLLRPSLIGLLVLLDLSNAAMHRVYLNFAWSFVYNLFAILLAGGAFVHARIAPQYAGLGEVVSVLPVILVAWQLRFFTKQYGSGLE
ncbi:hypothetical protein LTR86_002027 [Recurvomyces mirabilis]|nr:hypothetical protein LTR86_002027 [Recurvomyces mirabilis]